MHESKKASLRTTGCDRVPDEREGNDRRLLENVWAEIRMPPESDPDELLSIN